MGVRKLTGLIGIALAVSLGTAYAEDLSSFGVTDPELAAEFWAEAERIANPTGAPRGDPEQTGTTAIELLQQAYRSDPEAALDQLTITDASKLWQANSVPTPIWGDARDFVTQRGDRSDRRQRLRNRRFGARWQWRIGKIQT